MHMYVCVYFCVFVCVYLFMSNKQKHALCSIRFPSIHFSSHCVLPYKEQLEIDRAKQSL